MSTLPDTKDIEMPRRRFLNPPPSSGQAVPQSVALKILALLPTVENGS